ncbi:MAG: hypothetical protein AAF681_06150 [Pseudomonadota bacterium]
MRWNELKARVEVGYYRVLRVKVGHTASSHPPHLYFVRDTLRDTGGPVRLLICLALMSAFWIGAGTRPGLAQDAGEFEPNRADIVRLLGEVPDYAPIREELIALGFEGENLELAVSHAELVYRDPVLAGHVADQVISAFLDPGNAQVAGGLIWPMVERGLGHLNARELRFYYRVERSLIGGLPVRDCGRAVRNRLPPARFAELITRAAARLNTSGLREYYRIQARAARFGIQREPVRLSQGRADDVEAEINAQIRASIERSGQPSSLLTALDDLNDATNRQACEIGKLFLETVVAMSGQDGRDALIYMSLP